MVVAGCGTRATRPVERVEPPPVAKPAATKPPAYVLKKGGGFYQDDGPGDNPPENLDAIPDAVPRDEPLNRYANRPYSVLGRDYVPLREVGIYRATGIASWYGRKFHGQKTSTGETYDMYGMTAAHPTLPIPSYARVTNPGNGRSVVVRVNDRGPFLAGRVIDLSYTAAWKLGYVGNGSTLVQVESIVPGMDTSIVQTTAVDADPIAQIAAMSEPPAKPLPIISDARGIYLQLGAFGSADNAEALRSRLARELADLGGQLVIRAEGGLHRLQLGPWSTREEARRIADKIADAMEVRPIVVQH
jgi:rare lipoprotein A